MKITFGNIRLNLFKIKEVTNALTLDTMSETSLSQVPCLCGTLHILAQRIEGGLLC